MHDGKQNEKLRKLFVGGLKATTDDQTLSEYFSRYGTLTDCAVVKDPSGRSRKFGFVTYESPETVDAVQTERPHRVDGKEVETKRPAPKDDPTPNAQAKTAKLFVGGLKREVTEEDLSDYFGSLGKVKSVEIIKHRDTGASRGFAFVTFEDHDFVDKIYLMDNHYIKGNRVDTKKAVSKEEMRRSQPQQNDYYSNSRSYYNGNSFGNYTTSPYNQYDSQGWGGYQQNQWGNQSGGWNSWNAGNGGGYSGGMGDGVGSYPSGQGRGGGPMRGGRGRGSGSGRGSRGGRRPY